MMCTSSICVQFWEKWRWQGPLLNLCCDWDVCDLWVCIYPQRQQGFFLTMQKGKCPRMPLSETGLSLLLTSNPMELFLLTESNTSDASRFQTLFDVPLWRSRIHFLSECSVTLKQNTCSEHMTRIHDTQSKKKSPCLWNFHHYKAIKVASHLQSGEPWFEVKYGCKNTLS